MTNGMDSGVHKGKQVMEGSSRGKEKESPSNPGITEIEFTLVELSILVQILRNIELTTILANPNKGLPELVKDNMRQYFLGFKYPNLPNSPAVVNSTFNKIMQVIGYYNQLLTGIKIPSPPDEAAAIELIKIRMKDCSLTMDTQNYYSLLSDRFMRSKMLMSLQEAENSEENIIFPSSFVRDTIGDVQKHFPLLYRNFAIHEELTVNECQIVLQTFSNTEQTLYELVESLNNENLLIKLKLEKYVINPLLVNQMYANQPEYLQENTEHLGYGIVKPIQKHHEIVHLIRDVCGIPPGNN
uniref:Uncharacterized protein n=1 Tax=Meloidogyne javanica TaxID=6303 RepID=A0A915LZ56_MELJA